MERRFQIARNPDDDSTLPFLVRLPIGAHGMVLRARESWPRTSKVFCFRGNDAWPAEPELIDDVVVRVCERRGVAIDLVLDRRKENRSQFIFTRLQGGREAIFWQTSRTTAKSRPGVRVPGRRASFLTDLTIQIDTREHYPFRFARQKTETFRAPLPVGDYGASLENELVAIVERKSLVDLIKGLSDGSLPYQMAEMASFPRAAVVVEDHYSNLFKNEYVAGGALAEMLAKVQIRYPNVPIVFCDTRPLAEEWTFRFLGAAIAMSIDQPQDPTDPRLWIEPTT